MKRTTYEIDALQLSVLEKNPESSSVIFFLHGIPASAEIWRGVIAKFSDKQYRCIAPDLPGYGFTIAKKGFDFSLKNTSVYLNKFLESINAKEVWLVGHDIGGGIAQIMITQKPELFKKVTLSNCVANSSWPVPAISKLQKLAKKKLFSVFSVLGFFSSKKFFSPLQRSFVNPEMLTVHEFKRIFYDGKFSKLKSAKEFQLMLAALNNTDTAEIMNSLQKCRLHVHLIWGLKDRFQPWEGPGKLLESTFENAVVTKIDAGHYLQLDVPEIYLEALMGK